jgi:hypothetical protein
MLPLPVTETLSAEGIEDAIFHGQATYTLKVLMALQEDCVRDTVSALPVASSVHVLLQVIIQLSLFDLGKRPDKQ